MKWARCVFARPKYGVRRRATSGKPTSKTPAAKVREPKPVK